MQTSHADTNSEPTKEVRQWNGIPLNITTRTGESRFLFSPPMTCDYGCIRGSWGAGLDGKALDVYVIGDAPTVFRVVQITPTGAIDEYKYVLGAQNFDEAVSTFLKHVPKQLFGAASQYSIGQLQDDIAQQSKVRKDVNELVNFVEQLEELIESDDAYSSNVYVLSFEVADNGDISGRFEDAWNDRIFSYSVQRNRIGYKPALTLDRADSATAAKLFDIFSSGYTSLQVRQDAVKNGKKPRCTAISYGCGRACIQLQNTCWINSSGQRVKKAGGSVASISQGRIDKLRVLARYLAANGNNKWSKYGSAELLAAKASNLEAARNRLITSGVKQREIVPQKSRELQLKVKTSDLKRAVDDAFISGDFSKAQLLAKEVSGMMASGKEVVDHLSQLVDVGAEKKKLKLKHDIILQQVNRLKNFRGLDAEAAEYYDTNWTQDMQKSLENCNKFTSEVAREFIYVDPSIQSKFKDIPIGVVAPTTQKKVKAMTQQHTNRVRKALDDFERMVGLDYTYGKEIEVGIINPKATKSQRPFAIGSSIYISENESTEVIIHEAAHVLEGSFPGIHEKVQKFFDKRTTGDLWQSLRKLTGKNYGKAEVTKRDQWINPYMGKKASEGNSEILSMGMETMYDDPVGFAKKDPEYFAFMYDTLRGR